jgi:hypothetical protein
MKPNPSLDELLCSFMDGELSPRQRTEVQRMAARDPEVARRLQQLQSCRSLICSLPPAQAPCDLLEQVRLSMERRTLLQEQPVFARRSAGAWQLAFRKLSAAAAMIALLAVLGAVVYQIMAPVASTGPQPLVSRASRPRIAGKMPATRAVAPTVVADAGFSGRLELKTAALVQADASVKRAIEDNGLAGSVEVDMISGGRVYRLVSTRAGVNRLITSLSGVWPSFDSATFHVSRLGEAIDPVVVEAITPGQAVSIVARNTTEASIEAAESYALINGVERNIPGSEIVSLIGEDTGSAWALLTVPQPRETRPSNATLAPPQGEVEASLTIVLLSTR